MFFKREVEVETPGRASALASKGAMAAGVIGAGYVAGRAMAVSASLSEPRRPFEWRPERGKSVLLKRANVIDVVRGQVLKERGVLFKDGQVTGVLATRDVEKAQADTVIDCQGLFLIPGLINCHCHPLMPGSFVSPGVILSVKRQAVRNFEECALRGITTLRDTSSLSRIIQDVSGRIEAFDMLGPRIVSCGPVIGARGGYPDFSRQLPGWLAEKYGDMTIYADTPDEARDAVRRSVEQGARFIKIFFDDRSLFFGRKPLNVMDDETVKALLDEAHRLGRRVAVHQSEVEGFRRAVRLGVDDFEHVPMDGVLEDEDIAAFMAGDHCITPTASVAMALGVAPDGHPSRLDPVVESMQRQREKMARRDFPAVAEASMVKSNRKTADLYLSGKAEGAKFNSMLFDNMLFIEAIETAKPNVGKLIEAGARVCCGNDGGVPLLYPALLLGEMETMSLLGMPNADILRSATVNAARLLDMQDELGTLEAGKLADMVVLSANPLEDIRAIDRIEGVFRSGTLLVKGARLII